MQRWRVAVAVAAAVASTAATMTAGATPAAAATVPDQWTASSATAGNTSANEGERVITAATAGRLREAWQVRGTLGFVAPAIVNGVVYQAFNAANANDRGAFVALDVRTGKRLWSVPLPAGTTYYRGVGVSGRTAALPFEGWHRLGGVTAVDLVTHKLLWSRSRPPSLADPGNDDGTGAPIAVDAGRVYLAAGNDDLSAYDLRTGRLLWHRTASGHAAVAGIAAPGGRLYTGGFVSAAGAALVAYDGASGRQSWRSPYLYGRPVVAGNTVMIASDRGVAGVTATGCGRATCGRRWEATIPDAYALDTLIGGADGSTAFVSVTLSTDDTSRLVRLSTATGRIQWTAKRSRPSGEIPIRAGNTVWIMEFGDVILGYPATGTSTKPVRVITVPSNSQGVVGGLAAARGSLVHEAWPATLTAYRVPGH